MKNKSVKLPFVTKNSKQLVGTSSDDSSALTEFTPLQKTNVKLPFVTKNSKHLGGTSGDYSSAVIEFTPL